MKKVILIFLLLILIAVFAISAYNIISPMLEYNEAESTYNSIAENFVSYSKDTGIPEIKTDPESKDDIPSVKVNFPIEIDKDLLNEYNNDIIGWIYLPETSINYPVLQSTDNDYYLRKMADKKYNVSGSIFMDYRNESDFSHINTLIYGHNMKNGSMFSDITNYSSISYYEAHPYVYYMSTEKNYILKVIGSRKVATNDRIFTEFETESELQDYLNSCDDILIFDQNTDLNNINKLVTLSTCSNDTGTVRYLLFCIPIECEN